MLKLVRLCRLTAVLAVVGTAAACHGSSSSNTATDQQVPFGIFSGTDASGNAVTAIIDTAYSAVFISAAKNSAGQLVYTQYTGVLVQALQSSVDGTLHGYPQALQTFADGNDFGIGTLGGIVTTNTSLSGTFQFTTVPTTPPGQPPVSTPATTTSTTWTLSFDSIYNTAGTLSAIAGNYADATLDDPSSGATVSITSSGAVTAQAPATGCALTGQINASTESNDIYTVTLSYASCTNASSVLNSIQFTGFAILNTSVSPAEVTIAVTGESSKQVNYGVVMALTAT
jgi:hypothetical protein